MALTPVQAELRKKVYQLAGVNFEQPWKDRFRQLAVYLKQKGIEKPGTMMSDENWQKLYETLASSS